MQIQKEIDTHPMEGHKNSWGRGEGSLKSKFKKEGMKLNWNFLGDGGSKTNTFLGGGGGGLWIFSGTAQWC